MVLRFLPNCFHESHKLLEIRKDAKKVQWYLKMSKLAFMDDKKNITVFWQEIKNIKNQSRKKLLLPAVLSAAETKKVATKDTRFCQRFAHVVRKFQGWS